ncbi:right-handed parallel beta-helix repeat-containing protein [Cognatitamlana onchidii]|uniref:right-handed parallel beta-helix repeat-containing protein n=1 Tax=Cognatitamlana onchidii TaxID=2562860 RepID=UPI0010A6918D|nr:right-handed parallel beta-helix repeat-containing protein [Algibacter onchidii]
MKKIFIYMLISFILVFSLTVTSCNKEELFIEPTTEVVEKEEKEEESDDKNNADDTGETVDNSLPCEFSLNNLKPNTTVIIDCFLDLEGKIVNLPPNVNIEYDGGEIINGTLNLSEGTVIEGELLNDGLSLEGASPQLKDPTFKFVPSRWGIVEGLVSDAVAMNNKNLLNDIMKKTKSMGIKTFQIDEMDAYFNVHDPNNNSSPVEQALRIPGNFNFVMTENTHLRVQPNAHYATTLISVYMESNVVIEGGYLHGERDNHNYSSGGTHEWGHLLTSRGSVNLTVRNVVMMDGTGDGLTVQGEYHATDPRYAPTRNLLVEGCTFIRNRRNNVSITSCDGVVIDDCEFIDAGIHTGKSQGTPPSLALDVEALKPNELAVNILIKNCKESGSRRGGFLVAIGDFVTIENTYSESGISLASASNCVVRYNEVVAVTDISKSNGSGLNCGRADRGDLVHGNRVYGNTVNGFATGITMSNTDLEVYENKILNCKNGIALGSVNNAKAYKNIINSNRLDSDGIYGNTTNDVLTLSDNNINVTRFPLRLQGLNSQTKTNKIVFSKNVLEGGKASLFSEAHGIDFLENKFYNGMLFFDCTNINLFSNSITSDSGPAIYLRNVNSNIVMKDNISATSNSECIVVLSSNNINTIVDQNNSCN